MQNDKYLLYIDILGFSELVKNNSQKVGRLYSILDDLNMHMHGEFRTIVFSDTILCYNSVDPIVRKENPKKDDEYIVMYQCEFVQNLLYDSAELTIPFRAILTHGEFSYKKLRNIEQYYGKALIDAHNKEGEINGMGLFIHKDLLKYNRVFPTSQFDRDFYFVYLMQNMERVRLLSSEIPIVDSMIFEDLCIIPSQLKAEIEWLKTIKKNMDDSTLPSKVRGKYVQTYYLYQQQYGELIKILEQNDFDCKKLFP